MQFSMYDYLIKNVKLKIEKFFYLIFHFPLSILNYQGEP